MFCHGELARLQARPALPDALLPDDLARRRARRGAGGDRRAARAARLLRARHRARAAGAAGAAAAEGRRRWSALAVVAAAVFVPCAAATTTPAGVRVMERDFYGVVRTRDTATPVPYRSMYHGGIIHGGQLLGDRLRNTPRRLLRPGLGLRPRVRRAARAASGSRWRVGVIGLGAGVIAAWRPPGDRFVFYEISPRVVDIARSRVHASCATRSAKTEIVLGDGRLSLEREPPRALRRARHRRLLRRLDPDAPRDARGDGASTCAPQAGRRDRVPGHQPLHRPAAGGEAPRRRSRHGRGTGVRHPAGSDIGPEYWLSATDQIIVTRNRALFGADALRYVATPISDRADLATFTDTHHNLFRILK